MELNISKEYILKGKNGKNATFSWPYLNDNKELELKFCSFFSGKIVVNEEKQAIELRGDKKKIFLLLRGENEKLFREFMKTKRQILQDLRRLTNEFKTGKEPLYAIELGNEQCPFLITSPSVLENGQFSVKYDKAIMYFINEKAKEKGKTVQINRHEEMLQTVGQAIKKSDLDQYESSMMGSDKYYSISIDKVAELL